MVFVSHDGTSTEPKPRPENPSTNTTPGTETPAANTTANPEPAPTRSPGPWNKAQLGEMSKAERICLAAQQDKYSAALARQQLTPEQLTAYLASVLIPFPKEHR